MKKILHISKYYYPFVGGTEQVARDVVNALRASENKRGDEDMKNILQIPNYMYPHIGGIEQVARDFAGAIPREEYEQKIICFNEDAQDGDYVCHRGETVHDGVQAGYCGFPLSEPVCGTLSAQIQKT